MKCCDRRSRLLLSLLLAAASGCVTRGTHQEVLLERDALEKRASRLEAQVARLGASQQSLSAERVKLIDESEDMRQAREALEADLRRLQEREAALSDSLAAREAEIAALRGTYDGLVADLEAEVSAGQIEIEQLRGGLQVNLSQEILFPSGSASLNARGVAVLRKVALRLKSLPNPIEVHGHTDNVAVKKTSRYGSNWELAAARSAQVVRLFTERGIGPERLTVVSRGEFSPIASNDTPAGRAKNRRIEIRLLPSSVRPTPEAAPPDPA